MIKLKIFAETMGQMADLEGAFKCSRDAGKGMHIIVNGWCLSTQAGWGSYCSADPTRYPYENMPEPIEKLTAQTIRKDCEIAIWNMSDKRMIELDGDTVMGYVSWDMVFDIIEWLRKGKNKYKEIVIEVINKQNLEKLNIL